MDDRRRHWDSKHRSTLNSTLVVEEFMDGSNLRVAIGDSSRSQGMARRRRTRGCQLKGDNSRMAIGDSSSSHVVVRRSRTSGRQFKVEAGTIATSTACPEP